MILSKIKSLEIINWSDHFPAKLTYLFERLRSSFTFLAQSTAKEVSLTKISIANLCQLLI